MPKPKRYLVRKRKRRRNDSMSNLAFSARYLRLSRELYNRYLESKPWLTQLYSDFLDIRQRQKIVDVGCGLGDFTRFLARLSDRKAKVLGIDSNKKSIQVAIADTKKEGLSQVSYKIGDVYKLPLDDDYADLTCCRTLMSHLTEPLAAVKEMARVTKTNGSVVAVERGKMVAYHDPYDKQYSSLSEQEYESWVNGIRKLEGKDFWIGTKLPGIFQKAGLSDIKAEVHADAFLNTDPRRRLKDVKDQIRFDYSISKESRRTDRKYLLAGGMSKQRIKSFFKRFESRTEALLKDDKKLRMDASFYGDSFILVSGTKKRLEANR